MNTQIYMHRLTLKHYFVNVTPAHIVLFLGNEGSHEARESINSKKITRIPFSELETEYDHIPW